MKPYIVPIAWVALLSACSDGGSDSPPAASTPPPQIITDAGEVKGVDANTNRIRDDVDQLIAQKYSATPAIRKSAEQQAASIQSFMEATTKDEAIAEGQNITRAAECIWEAMPGAEQEELRRTMSAELEAATVNSQARIESYIQANKLANGAYFSDPASPVCD